MNKIYSDTHLEEGRAVRVIISNNSEVPIYQQIKNQIKDEILKGNLTDGELLPSIRHLANETGVSVLTSKRAYDELGQEGYINGVQGKGFFVAAQNMDILREGKIKEVENKFLEAFKIAEMIDISNEDLKTMFEILLQDKGR